MKLLCSLLVCLFSITLSAQNYEGIYLKFGINTAYPEWENVDLLMKEFNELRPWLTEKPTVGYTFGGWNFGYGVCNKWLMAEMCYMSNRNNMRYQGVDSSGIAHKGTFTVINRALSLGGGVKIVPTQFVRIGIMASLSANPLVIKKLDDQVLKQRLATFFLMPILFTKYQPSPLDSKFYLSGTLSANVQIGGNYGVTVEPFYNFPFWKTDFNSTRTKLNGLITMPYEDSAFKSSLAFWGIKFCAFIGFSG